MNATLEDLEKIERKELNLLDELERKVGSINQPSISKEEIIELKKIVKRQTELTEKIERASDSKTGRYIIFEYFFEEEEKIEEIFKKDFADLRGKIERLKQQKRSELDLNHDQEKMMRSILSKLERMEKYYSKNFQKVMAETKVAAKQDINQRIDNAVSRVNKLPTIYFKASVMIKMNDVVREAINNQAEEGGFLHYQRKNKDFYIDSFFHEPNALRQKGIDAINKWEDLRKLNPNLTKEEIKKLKQEMDLETFKQQFRDEVNSGTSYMRSGAVNQMINQKYGEENLLTWHSHPDDPRDYDCKPSEADKKNIVKGKIHNYYYEIIAHELGPENSYNSIVPVPFRWKGCNSRSFPLPIWVVESGNRLTEEEMKRNWPSIYEYNQGLLRGYATDNSLQLHVYMDNGILTRREKRPKIMIENGNPLLTEKGARLMKSFNVESERFL